MSVQNNHFLALLPVINSLFKTYSSKHTLLLPIFDHVFHLYLVELLADVPAVENPEFKQAVADMIQSDHKQEESPEEKSSTPPDGAGGE